MSVSRRRFLENVAFTAAAANLLPAWASSESSPEQASTKAEKPYGSGYFGNWIEDEFGLPAFHYTCDQTKDPKALTQVNPGILSSSEHIHQVGNDRLVAVASNFGHVRVRQDEGAPKFLNDYAPERGQFGGGFGYLTDGKGALSTFFPGNATSFDRIFGIGYFRKKVAGEAYSVDQVTFAPFGDDPVLISQVSVTNTSPNEAKLRWTEYWGCQLYQFSFRAFMEADSGKNMHELRRDFAARFSHEFKAVGSGSGLLEKKEFLGRDPVEERQFRATLASIEKNPGPFLAMPEKNVPKQCDFDDLNPPPTFLISLDAPADGMSTNGKAFFGTGGAAQPSGLEHQLDGDLSRTGPESAMLLERRFTLKPGETRTLSFMYGYLPSGKDLDALTDNYRKTAQSALRNSCQQWKKSGLHFSVEHEPWVEREVAWNHYYLRSGVTYDTFFHQRIISQASIYQYVMGFQGAARDPLQHSLPFIFSDPDLVRDVLRYTLKEVRADGSIPYGIVGHGMPMPTVSDNSSDMPLWLLWVASEYILATRDLRFLDSDVVTVYDEKTGRDTVRNLLARCYKHVVEDVKTGQHGLMRMLRDDWNDALLQNWLPAAGQNEGAEKGESVVNSAMAAFVFDYYARMLTYSGDDGRISSPIRQKAEEHRAAVRAQWTGKWFRRAWLGPSGGWLGEKGMWIEPQPWALIARITTEEQTKTLVKSIDEELRRPSPIGAVQINDSPDRITNGVWKSEPGTSIAGGVWPSLNQTLIWALSSLDNAMAWDEWKKNSFARHAEVYPEIWYGTWSGPDVLNSASSKHPGATTGGQPFGWTDFPVLPTFRFESPLVTLIKSERGYEGWYNPTQRNTWSIRVDLTSDEAKRIDRFEVNGNRIHARKTDHGFELRGQGGSGDALRWSAFRN